MPISFTLQRRDGPIPHFCSPDGAFHFYMPSQCMGLGKAECDLDLLRAIESALSKQDSVIDKIESAIPFFEAANRDDGHIGHANELVMTVAAYEHLLCPKALALSQSLADLLTRFRNGKTVADARLNGRTVFEDPAHDQKLAQAPIHQGWIYELHKVRSALLHPICNGKGGLHSSTY